MTIFTSLWLMGMALLLWMPLPPGGPSPLGHMDVVIHFGLFSIFGHLLWHTIRPDENRFFWLDWALLTCLVAVVLESGQYVIPGRSVQGLDYAVNIIGGFAGGVSCLPRNTIQRWIGGLAPALFSLLVGFSGILFGDILFEFVLRYQPPSRDLLITSAGLILFLVIFLYTRPGNTTKKIDYLFGILLLAGVVLTIFVSPAWSVLTVVTATGMVLFPGPRSTTVAGQIVRPICFVLFLFTLLASWRNPQNFLDGFGLFFVSANLFALGILVTVSLIFTNKPAR